MTSQTKKSLMIFQKEMLGILGFMLVPFAICFGLAGESNPTTWWHSISMTYYANSNICMIGVLFSMSVLFFSYYGYDTSDKILSFVAGVCSMGILVFPCGYEGIPGGTTGLFGINWETSFTIHCIFASLLFIDFAIMTGYSFTKSAKDGQMTQKKKTRNTIYKVCSITICVFMLNQAITSILSCPGWWTLINEFVMLLSFSFAWLVKAEFFKKFND